MDQYWQGREVKIYENRHIHDYTARDIERVAKNIKTRDASISLLESDNTFNNHMLNLDEDSLID